MIVILASRQDHSSIFGSTKILSPILAIVTEIGIVVIGGSIVSFSIFTGKSSCISYLGSLHEINAAVVA